MGEERDDEEERVEERRGDCEYGLSGLGHGGEVGGIMWLRLATGGR